MSRGAGVRGGICPDDFMAAVSDEVECSYNYN